MKSVVADPRQWAVLYLPALRSGTRGNPGARMLDATRLLTD